MRTNTIMQVLLTIVATCFWVSCTNGNSSSQSKPKSQEEQQVQPASKSQQKRAELEKTRPFTTPDLKWVGVHGRVKRIQEYTPKTPLHYEEEKEYTFDYEGNLKSLVINGETYRIKRVATGQIDRVFREVYNTDFGETFDFGEDYKYNTEGYVIQKSNNGFGWSSDWQYDLSEDGMPVSASCQDVGDCDDVLQKYIYTYSNIDAQGNWQKQNTQLTLMYESPQVVDYSTSRTITYYDSDSDVKNSKRFTTDNNEWIYGTWKCRTPYGTIKVIVREDGRMYNSIDEGWNNYTIEGNRIIEQCKGYISTYNIDRVNKCFDCGEPGVWFYKE